MGFKVLVTITTIFRTGPSVYGFGKTPENVPVYLPKRIITEALKVGDSILCKIEKFGSTLTGRPDFVVSQIDPAPSPRTPGESNRRVPSRVDDTIKYAEPNLVTRS